MPICKRRSPASEPMPPKPQPVGLRIELKDVKPLVWRRIVVSNQWTFASLHNYVQWVMGWQDSHAHEFHIGSRVVAPQWWIREMEFDRETTHCVDERRISVAAVASEVGVGGVFEYHYDMGDGWEHRLIVEAPPTGWADHDFALPACTAGENACPPEDVGGPHGYERFLACLADPSSGEHIDTRRWVGGVFDPAGFDLNRVNRHWSRTRRRRR
jgi:pRiA4b ORF-3-like protein